MPHHRIYPSLDLLQKSGSVESRSLQDFLQENQQRKVSPHMHRPALGLWICAAVISTILLFIVAAYW